MSRRVVVTGVGLVTPVGVGTEETWQAIREGRSGIGPITAFDASAFACRIAAEVKGFVPENYIERKEIRRMGRFIQFAIAACDMAMNAAGLKLDETTGERAGVDPEGEDRGEVRTQRQRRLLEIVADRRREG